MLDWNLRPKECCDEWITKIKNVVSVLLSLVVVNIKFERQSRKRLVLHGLNLALLDFRKLTIIITVYGLRHYDS